MVQSSIPSAHQMFLLKHDTIYPLNRGCVLSISPSLSLCLSLFLSLSLALALSLALNFALALCLSVRIRSIEMLTLACVLLF